MYVHVIKDSDGCATVTPADSVRQSDFPHEDMIPLLAVPGWPEKVTMPSQFIKKVFTDLAIDPAEHIVGLVALAKTVNSNGDFSVTSNMLDAEQLGLSDWTELDGKTFPVSKFGLEFYLEEIPWLLVISLQLVDGEYLNTPSGALSGASYELQMSKKDGTVKL